MHRQGGRRDGDPVVLLLGLDRQDGTGKQQRRPGEEAQRQARAEPTARRTARTGHCCILANTQIPGADLETPDAWPSSARSRTMSYKNTNDKILPKVIPAGARIPIPVADLMS